MKVYNGVDRDKLPEWWRKRITLSSIRIPHIKENEITSVIEDGLKECFIGVKHDKDTVNALKLITAETTDCDECFISYDFRAETEMENQRWRVCNKYFMVYQNTETNERTCLINGEPTGYEKVFWFMGKLKTN